jgi:Replication-relaxation
VSLLEQLRFLARVRVASPRQFGAAFEHDAWWAYKRIARLCDQGLADRARPLREFPAAVWATPAGLAAVGLARSRPPRLSLDRLAHDLAVTELLLELGRTPRVCVLTERELWREQGRPGGIPVAGGRSAGSATHCPDLVVEVGGRRWAVEIEFSAKGRERLRRILAAYRGSDYTGVVYYVREPALARAISRLALDSRLNGDLALRAWELWPTPLQDTAEIERVARRHREAALDRGNGAPATRRAPRTDADMDRRQRERAAAIEGWERELERRDSEQSGSRLRLARRAAGS